MRTLLFAYLIAVNVAGPRFCPCLVANGVIGSGECAAAGTLTSEPLPCGCVPHDLSRPAGPTLEDSSPDDPASGDHGRPCRCQCGASAVVATRPSARTAEADESFDIAPPALACGPVSIAASHTNPRPVRGSPFVTTEDLLYAFHFLRC